MYEAWCDLDVIIGKDLISKQGHIYYYWALGL